MLRPSDELVFVPLGGVGEIRMDLTIYGLAMNGTGNGSRSISASPSATIRCRASI